MLLESRPVFTSPVRPTVKPPLRISVCNECVVTAFFMGKSMTLMIEEATDFRGARRRLNSHALRLSKRQQNKSIMVDWRYCSGTHISFFHL